MDEASWRTMIDPRPVLDSGLLTDQRKLRLFCVACCLRVMDHFFDERSRIAVRVAEQYADGRADFAVLFAACEEAYYARSRQEGNFYTLDAGWFCSRQPPDARWCADACAAAAGLAVPVDMFDYTERWEFAAQCELLHDIFGNPFRPVAFDSVWRTDTAVSLAKGMYESRDFSAMPILADALQDAGCDNDDILNHCRGTGPHVRGCWVVDLVVGKA